MNGSRIMATDLVTGIAAGLGGISAATRVALCPPYVYLPLVGEVVAGTRIELGAQDVAAEPIGAYTGEVAASMLSDIGCSLVLVGHSERRALYGDSHGRVARKFVAALGSGLVPVLCVGETLEQRDRDQTEQVIGEQLAAVIDVAGLAAVAAAVIAYEPVWAIGTGRTATPDQAQEVHAFLRERLGSCGDSTPILYGGSLGPDNAAELFSMSDIDGGLVGRASLRADDFLAICRAA